MKDDLIFGPSVASRGRCDNRGLNSRISRVLGQRRMCPDQRASSPQESSIPFRLVNGSCPMSHTLVSVIIPTRNRPQLVLRAVRSALNQTYPHLEVIVVVDGPDPATKEALETVVDGRLRVVALDQSVGGSDARN